MHRISDICVYTKKSIHVRKGIQTLPNKNIYVYIYNIYETSTHSMTNKKLCTWHVQQCNRQIFESHFIIILCSYAYKLHHIQPI